MSSTRPRVMDPGWAPSHATVRTVRDEREARMVHQLRYRVYVHEQGKRPDGVNWERSELVDALDPCSHLWYACEGETIVGTLMRTIVGRDFDLGRLPCGFELDGFPRCDDCALSFSSRFAITPDHRGTWVLPSLARYAYAHGRELGAKFDFMATNPALVPLFERLGYVRYTASAVHLPDVGMLIPMVFPGTDHAHLRHVRSACLSAAVHYRDEPQWGAWLRDTRPLIDVYYRSTAHEAWRDAALAARADLPLPVAAVLGALGYVHRFPGGTSLLRVGDRVTCAFVPMDGRVRVNRTASGADPDAWCAPDGTPFSRATIRCETDAAVLCLPATAVARLQRRYPEHGASLVALLAGAA